MVTISMVVRQGVEELFFFAGVLGWIPFVGGGGKPPEGQQPEDKQASTWRSTWGKIVDKSRAPFRRFTDPKERVETPTPEQLDIIKGMADIIRPPKQGEPVSPLEPQVHRWLELNASAGLHVPDRIRAAEALYKMFLKETGASESEIASASLAKDFPSLIKMYEDAINAYKKREDALADAEQEDDRDEEDDEDFQDSDTPELPPTLHAILDAYIEQHTPKD